jgi:hypothetical protein
LGAGAGEVREIWPGGGEVRLEHLPGGSTPAERAGARRKSARVIASPAYDLLMVRKLVTIRTTATSSRSTPKLRSSAPCA